MPPTPYHTTNKLNSQEIIGSQPTVRTESAFRVFRSSVFSLRVSVVRPSYPSRSPFRHSPCHILGPTRRQALWAR